MADDSPIPAHALWVELSTRITTQKLHYRSGDEETAATSIYSLFKTTRDLMTAHPGAKVFIDVALSLLNDTLRPYTARWHGWMVEDSSAAPDEQGKRRSLFMNPWVRRKFREELLELKRPLEGYLACMDNLRKGAGLNPQDLQFLHEQRDAAPQNTQARLGDPLLMGIGSQVPFAATPEGHVDPATINVRETKEVRDRRRHAGALPAGFHGPVMQSPYGSLQRADSRKAVYNATGLALSGGGIRSATFCLGVVQALQKRRLFSQFDILSTVSGGGYLGSFLSSFLGVKADVLASSANGTNPPAAQPEGDRYNELFNGGSAPESEALRHLRTNSKYLLNGGAVGGWTAFGLISSGVLSNLMMLLPLPLLAALITAICWQWGFWQHDNPASMKMLKIMARAAFVCLLLVPVVQKVCHGAKAGSRRAWTKGFVETLALAIGFFLLLSALLTLVPGLFAIYAELRAWLGEKLAGANRDSLLAAVTGLASTIFGRLAIKRSPEVKGAGVRKWAMHLFILSGPLFFLFVYLLVGNRLGLDGDVVACPCPEWTLWSVAAWAAGLFAWAWFFININTLSPHRFYRARLCECYLVVKDWAQRTLLMRLVDWVKFGKPFGWWSKPWVNHPGAVGSVQQIPLGRLGEVKAAPYHLINTVVNLPSSLDNQAKGRGGDFFLFSKHFCGSPVVGYVPTADLVDKDKHLDLGTAMAISGAAASTNMGWKTMKSFRFLLALLNIRLGYWVPNPLVQGGKKHRFGPNVFYFLKEIMGWMHEKSRFLNLSDGGHIENLATYELLRRRCKFIVCVDAGMEPGMECADLMRLQRYAKVDFGFHMHFDPTDLTVLPTRFSKAYAVLVKIDYAPGKAVKPRETSDELGWMLYMKLAVTGTEPRYVLDYRRENPDFPHQSTGDQLYDEAQFEAYRALGEVAAASLLRSEIVGPNAPTTIEAWFQSLADTLLPDNDEAAK